MEDLSGLACSNERAAVDCNGRVDEQWCGSRGEQVVGKTSCTLVYLAFATFMQCPSFTSGSPSGRNSILRHAYDQTIVVGDGVAMAHDEVAIMKRLRQQL